MSFPDSPIPLRLSHPIPAVGSRSKGLRLMLSDLIWTEGFQSDGAGTWTIPWRRSSPEMATTAALRSGVDALVVSVPPRARGGDVEVRLGKAEVMERSVVSLSSWNAVEEWMEARRLRRFGPRMRHFVRLRKETREVVRGCARTRGRGRRAHGLRKRSPLAGDRRNTAAGGADSGELLRRPGGTI